ncbi:MULTISPECIES: DUF1176 domain-containing protein [unclassified Sphingopyxis]|uniref:DUF1176 domain-containing protein n=1 Tax=Sphingopyxis sp. DBS4 TaxID=2968500 RepID=UPI00214CE479|nr:DUF1176 domain-containing protein [Sphingopyxis sp. DBS4]
MSLLAAAALTSPIGTLQTYRDWTVGCDNMHACHATTLLPEPTEEEVATSDEPIADNSFNLSLRRGGGMHDLPRLRLIDCYLCEPEAGQEPASAREVLVKDKGGAILVRRTWAEGDAAKLAGDGLPIPADDGLIEALGKGETAEVLDGKRGVMATISLRGLAAAMRYIDTEQHRTSNVTALIARGAAAAYLVPPWIPEPPVYLPPPSDLPPTQLTGRSLEELQQEYRCDHRPCGLPDVMFARLDARTTMLLLFANCAPYNGEGYVFLLGNDGAVRSAPVRLMSRDPALAPPQVVSSYWDHKERRLHSFGRGRALGDCGQEQAFAWDGEQFILVEEADMGDCRGSIDYITVYRRETAVRDQHR